LAIEFYGQFQFDLVKKKAVFSLDELTVVEVTVDLASAIETAKELDEVEEEKGEDEGKEEKEEDESKEEKEGE